LGSGVEQIFALEINSPPAAKFLRSREANGSGVGWGGREIFRILNRMKLWVDFAAS